MMKKISVCLLSLILILLLSFPSFVMADDSPAENTTNGLTDEERIASELEHVVPADEMNASLEGLISEWEMNCYPDNVGNVYYDSSSGKYMIGLVNDDEAHRNEIRSLLSNSDFQDFETATYSYNDLLAVHHEIGNEMADQKNISSVGIGWTTIDGELTGFGESGKEFRVVVQVDESIFDEYAKKYENQYGDMVYVEIGSAGIEEASDGVRLISKQVDNNMWVYTAFIAILCIAILAAVFMKRNRFMLVKQTTNAELVTESRPLRRNEVVSAVKESAIEPTDGVYKAIMKEIENK